MVMAEAQERPLAVYLVAISSMLPATVLQQTLMATLDAINRRMGRGRVFYAASGIKRPWAMAANMRSRHFTTDWEQLLQVSV